MLEHAVVSPLGSQTWLGSQTRPDSQKPCWPRFEEIPEPKMVCFGVGNGSGTKLFQSFLDGHPQIYMIPGYPLLYLYPHWDQWRDELKDRWCWQAVVERFLVHHASVLDSRRIPAGDGLTTLGDQRNQWLETSEADFRECLLSLLKHQTLSSRTFLLAVHYAYSLVREERIQAKKVLVYHIHVHEYVPKYLLDDFPEMLTLAFVRDPRSNIRGRHETEFKIDNGKLDGGDAILCRHRKFYFTWEFLLESLECLRGLPPERVKAVRHEDMIYHLDRLMKSTATFLRIEFHPSLLTSTFGGLKWWGDKIYGAKPMNRANPAVVSSEWKRRLPHLDWFVLEGLFHHYCDKYHYEVYKYRHDSLSCRIKLLLALCCPMHYERDMLKEYFRPQGIIRFGQAIRQEAMGEVQLKDYRFNAYYRHKWSNRGLALHKVKWYKRLLLRYRERVEDEASLQTQLLGWMAIACYWTANLCRYGGTLATLPVIIAKRVSLSLKHYRLVMSDQCCLPELIIEPSALTNIESKNVSMQHTMSGKPIDGKPIDGHPMNEKP